MFLSTFGVARGRIGCGSRQNSLEQSVFCLLCGPQALDLVAGVDKIRRKSLFLSTFGVAVGGFGCGSRQNLLEQSVFCLLCGPQALDLVVGVDKIR